MLTPEEKAKIYKRNDEGLRPYLRRIMDELPNLEDDIAIEEIANYWCDGEFYLGKKISLDKAIEMYKKMYEWDKKEIKKLSGIDLPPLNAEVLKPVYEINEDLTQAIMENLKDKLEFAKKVEEHNGDAVAAFLDGIDDEPNRFYGTVLNEDTLKRLDRANSLLDIIKTDSTFNVQKFKEANPRCTEGIVAINIVRGCPYFRGVLFKAFRELIDSADEFDVILATETKARFVFIYHDLWAESRELTDDELAEEEEELTEEDMEEIEKELERFNNGDFSSDD